MCGRFFLARRAQEIAAALGLRAPRDMDRWRPRYNIAPGTDISVVLNLPHRPLEFVRWGVIPVKAKDPAIGFKMINSKAEAMAESKSEERGLVGTSSLNEFAEMLVDL